jgi:DNA-binding response OmpR family regulator
MYMAMGTGSICHSCSGRLPMQDSVLLVLADPSVLKRLVSLLAQRGYRCQAAPSLDAALAALRRSVYTWVVVDLDLLGSDVVGGADELRAASPGTRLVGLDALAERHETHRAAARFHAVLPKPFFLDSLLATLPPQRLPA